MKNHLRSLLLKIKTCYVFYFTCPVVYNTVQGVSFLKTCIFLTASVFKMHLRCFGNNADEEFKKLGKIRSGPGFEVCPFACTH